MQFLRRVATQAALDFDKARDVPGPWIFFDRGLIDAFSGLQHLTGEATPNALQLSVRYNRLVFLTPPWPEIYENDPERRHDLQAGMAEYERLTATYPSLGYQTCILPKLSVMDRADMVLTELSRQDRSGEP